jgi:hypothetical protein
MKLTFTSEEERKTFQENIVNCLAGLNIHEKEYESNKKFLKEIYHESK